MRENKLKKNEINKETFNIMILRNLERLVTTDWISEAYMRSIMKYSLWGITLACIYIICYVGLGWFYPLGTSTNFERINNVLLSLSYSYMAGFCFYILVEYLPKKVAQKKAYIVWKNGIVNIYMRMSEMIAALKMIYEISSEDKAISVNDVKKMNKYQPENEIIYFCETIYISDIGENGTTKGVFVFHENLCGLAKYIREEISNMIKLPSTSNNKIELIEVISEIESCEFIKTCSDLSNNILLHEHEMDDFGNKFYQFIQLHEKLSKYKFRQFSYKFRRLTEDEITTMKVEQKKVFQEIQNMGLNLGSCVFYKNEIRYIVSNGQLKY